MADKVYSLINAISKGLNMTGLNLNYTGIVDALDRDFILRTDPLVIDLDGDGVELLKGNGSYFFDVTGDGIAEEIDWISPDDGFLIHDTNNDGVFNANDTAWNEVKVWKDSNSNGILDNGELLTLEEAGVSSINLDYNNQNITDENGNEHLQTGSFVDADGNIKQITDVWFNTDTLDSCNYL